MKKSKIKKIIAIFVMLLLCIMAAAYIVRLVNNRAQDMPSGDDYNAEAESMEQDPMADDGTDQAAEDGTDEAAATEDDSSASSALQGVYSYSGKPEQEKFSYEAFDSAIQAGSDSIVLAYVVSNQGTPYVADDDFAEDRTGINGYFSGMTDAQIDAITTRAGGKVLKLRDVFEKYGDSVNYVIEIRYTTGRNIQALADLINEVGNADNITLSCLYFEGLSAFESSLPDVQKVFLCQDQGGFNAALSREYVDTVSVQKSIMTADNCAAAHEAGKQFGAWVLSTEEEIGQAKEIGVDSYYTDNAELAAGIANN